MRQKASLAVALFSTALAAGTARAEPVGRVTALQTSVAREGRPLSTGADISLGDRLVSNATGLGVVLFRDQSSAKIGPNSTLLIDDFVYGSGPGASGIRMDNGITRFFGGRISKKGRMEITTPHVVLAVRGGIVDVAVNSQGSVATLRAGTLTCMSGGTTQVITRPGHSCFASGGGIQTMRGGFDFSVLDSTSRIAGTGEPGTTGPSPDTRAPCTRDNAHLIDRCVTRDGELPGNVERGDRPVEPPVFGFDRPQSPPPPPPPDSNVP